LEFRPEELQFGFPEGGEEVLGGNSSQVRFGKDPGQSQTEPSKGGGDVPEGASSQTGLENCEKGIDFGPTQQGGGVLVGTPPQIGARLDELTTGGCGPRGGRALQGARPESSLGKSVGKNRIDPPEENAGKHEVIPTLVEEKRGALEAQEYPYPIPRPGTEMDWSIECYGVGNALREGYIRYQVGAPKVTYVGPQHPPPVDGPMALEYAMRWEKASRVLGDLEEGGEAAGLLPITPGMSEWDVEWRQWHNTQARQWLQEQRSRMGIDIPVQGLPPLQVEDQSSQRQDVFDIPEDCSSDEADSLASAVGQRDDWPEDPREGRRMTRQEWRKYRKGRKDLQFRDKWDRELLVHGRVVYPPKDAEWAVTYELPNDGGSLEGLDQFVQWYPQRKVRSWNQGSWKEWREDPGCPDLFSLDEKNEKQKAEASSRGGGCHSDDPSYSDEDSHEDPGDSDDEASTGQSGVDSHDDLGGSDDEASTGQSGISVQGAESPPSSYATGLDGLASGGGGGSEGDQESDSPPYALVNMLAAKGGKGQSLKGRGFRGLLDSTSSRDEDEPMGIDQSEGSIAQIAYVPKTQGEHQVVLVAPEKPDWQLQVQPLEWQVDPVQCDLQVPAAEGHEYVTTAQGRHILRAVEQCIKALSARDEAMQQWAGAQVSELHNLQAETKRLMEHLGNQMQILYDGLQKSREPVAHLEEWGQRADKALGYVVPGLQALQQQVSELSGATEQGLLALRGDVTHEIEALLDACVQPSLKELRQSLKELQDQMDRVGALGCPAPYLAGYPPGQAYGEQGQPRRGGDLEIRMNQLEASVGILADMVEAGGIEAHSSTIRQVPTPWRKGYKLKWKSK
jgi:hypothetical protein